MAFFDKREVQWMKCESPVGARVSLREWYEKYPGLWLQEEEQKILDEVLPDMFGYHLLQIGLANYSDCMRGSRIPHRMVMDLDLGPETLGAANPEALSTYPTQIRGSAEVLPFAADSLDVLLMTHTLEYASDPHEVLREADRVLIPEGHVVIAGFNPWGLWMLWRLALGWRGKIPWCGQFVSAVRLKDWLQLLGFDVISSHSCFFRPPLPQQSIMNRLRFFEKQGRRWWPFFSGAYVLVAKKRVATLTPMKPRWRPRRSRLVAPGLAGNSSVSNHDSYNRDLTSTNNNNGNTSDDE